MCVCVYSPGLQLSQCQIHLARYQVGPTFYFSFWFQGVVDSTLGCGRYTWPGTLGCGHVLFAFSIKSPLPNPSHSLPLHPIFATQHLLLHSRLSSHCLKLPWTFARFGSAHPFLSSFAQFNKSLFRDVQRSWV